MSKIFITGSSDGLGFLAGKLLREQGHDVVLHVRNEKRAGEVKAKLHGAEVVSGDVSVIAEMKSVAEQVNRLGKFDAVIHNVALGTNAEFVLTSDGLSQLFAVNVVAPYILTAMIAQPKRLVYMSSGMHLSGSEDHLEDGRATYSDTKYFDLVLSMYMARLWPQVFVNAVHPGWVPTRMGGKSAPDDLIEGATTQAWLAVSDEPAAKVSGHYFFHKQQQPYKKSAALPEVQDRVVGYLERITKLQLSK